MNNFRSITTCLGCKTRQQIAGEYGFCEQTLRRKLRLHSIKLPRGLVTPKWQKVIYEALGYPPGVSKTDYEHV